MKNNFKLIGKEEFQKHEHYGLLYPLACSFGHQIIQTEEGVWRWRPNAFAQYINSGTAPFYQGEWNGKTKTILGTLSVNQLWNDVYNKNYNLTPEHVMKYYMGIGYSLSGFHEVFDQKEAESFYEDAQPNQSVLDYVIKKWNGKIAVGIV